MTNHAAKKSVIAMLVLYIMLVFLVYFTLSAIENPMKLSFVAKFSIAFAIVSFLFVIVYCSIITDLEQSFPITSNNQQLTKLLTDENISKFLPELKDHSKEILKKEGEEGSLKGEQCKVLVNIVKGGLLLPDTLKLDDGNHTLKSIISKAKIQSGEKYRGEISEKGIKYLANILSAYYVKLNIKEMFIESLKKDDSQDIRTIRKEELKNAFEKYVQDKVEKDLNLPCFNKISINKFSVQNFITDAIEEYYKIIDTLQAQPLLTDENISKFLPELKDHSKEILKKEGEEGSLKGEQCKVLTNIVKGGLLFSDEFKDISARIEKDTSAGKETKKDFLEHIIRESTSEPHSNNIPYSDIKIDLHSKYRGEISWNGMEHLKCILSAHYIQLSLKEMPEEDLKYLNSKLPNNGGYVLDEINDNLEMYYEIINTLEKQSQEPVNTKVTVDSTNLSATDITGRQELSYSL